MKEQWIEDIGKMMDGYEVDAPEISWSEVEARVNANRSPRIVALWQRRVAVAASLLMIIAATTTLLFNNEPTLGTTASVGNTSTPLADNASTPLADNAPMPLADNAPTPDTKKILAKNDAAPSGGNRVGISPSKNLQEISENSLEISENPLEVSKEQTEMAENGKDIPESGEEVSESEKEVSNSGNKVPDSSNATSTKPREKKKTSLDYPEEYSPRKQKRSRLMASAYFGNGMSLGSSLGSAIVANELNSDMVDDNYRHDSIGEAPRPMLLSSSESSRVSIDHHKPVRVGLSVKYALDDRWAVESGLVYSYLRSDFNENYNASTLATKQKIGYIGIPLAASYRLADAKPFRFYVSAGTMVEIPVMAKDEESIISHGTTTLTQEYSLPKSGLQLSLSGRLGAELNFTPSFGIYVEPGVSYYFDNGSSVETYYSHKPFNLNLNIGVRLSFGR